MKLSLTEYPMPVGALAFSTERSLLPSQNEAADPYAGFNLTHYCGDSAEHVRTCREELARCLHLPEQHIFLPRQTHGTVGVVVDEALLSASAEQRARALEGRDAIFTRLRGVCVGVSTADCVPLLLHGQRAPGMPPAIGAVHAGWRGTVARIAALSLERMEREWGLDPGCVRVVIGPGISQAAFEVGDEVCDAFRDARFPMDRVARRMGENRKWHIDLFEANRLTLMDSGVLPDHILLTGLCTRTLHRRFFSARALGIKSGRIFSGILLPE